MITFDSVTIRYGADEAPVLSDVNLSIPEGELCLVIGETGSGKSTLLGAVNGLVPHFTGGVLSGSVTVFDRDTRNHPPRELADLVGVVGQDPRASFVSDIVEDELAYAMESLALPRDVMRRRIEDVLDALSLAPLRDRPVSTLSGGQAQRVAIGAVLTVHPKVLVLDEPTSALDPGAAEEVLAALQRLVHDTGLTVLLAEHRLERVLQYADSTIWVPGSGAPLVHGTPADVIAQAPVYPSVVKLGRLAGWQPVPLSVRDARRLAAPLRALLPTEPLAEVHGPLGDPLVETSGLTVRYAGLTAVDGVALTVRRGEIVALMGRNGAGKSSLFAALTGLVTPSSGHVVIGEAGRDPRSLTGRALIGTVGLVPQQAADLLYGESVTHECTIADREAGVDAGTCRAILTEIVGDLDEALHPRDLSEGQRLALALSVVLTARPPLILLDEPTRGLDYPAKERLAIVLRRLARDGHGLVVATHDVELAAELAHRVVVLADGEIVADGPSREVLTHSPIFAPQVAKVLNPLPYLTVGDVEAALEVTR